MRVCIRRWKVKFKSVCDSKVNPTGAKVTCAGISAKRSYHRLQHGRNMAERNAKVDYDGEPNGWTPELSAWYRERHEQYLKEA